MPIAALSDSDSRKIRSTLALNDAISIVKELIDNAFDANANNINIEISANTLDIIQVKDNGSGIGIEDRQLLCKRGFTSKIKTLEDLAQLGGTFLGFRGEALASIAELSKGIDITTRVDGENAGTTLGFDSNGKLLRSSSASQPTGTTVRVHGFLSTIPVRKQNALKHATRTLSAIKKLLFQYAFARPTVKLQFKVLKSKSDFKDNWSFAPNRNVEDLTLLAAKIVGKDVAVNCQREMATSEDGLTRIQALIVKRDADVSKTGSSDRYISIDGRPLTTTRGTMKELHKIYRAYLQRDICVNAQQAASQFLLLRLECPRGSYDVNVEPAKDEVMFADTAKISDMFEGLCERVYGKQDKRDASQDEADGMIMDSPHHPFDIFLTRKKPVTVASETQLLHQSSEKPQPRSPGRSIDSDGTSVESPYLIDNKDSPWRRGRRTGEAVETNNEAVPLTTPIQGFEDHDCDSEENIMSPQVTNPFVLAKLNHSSRFKPSTTASCLLELSSHQVLNDTSQDGHINDFEISKIMLPSPTSSPERDRPYQNPGPPNRPWKTRGPTESESTSSSIQASVHGVPDAAQSTLLQAWKPCADPAGLGSFPKDGIGIQCSDTLPSHESPTQSRQAARGGSGPYTTNATSAKTVQKPFHNPLNRSQFGTSSNGYAPTLELTHSPTKKLVETFVPWVGSLHPIKSTSNSQSCTELDDIMDFEHRKRSIMLQHRIKGSLAGVRSPRDSPLSLQDSNGDASLDSPIPSNGKETTMEDIPPQPASASYTQNPHWNRYKKAVARLSDTGTNVTPDATYCVVNPDLRSTSDREVKTKSRTKQLSGMLSHDPRSYLLRKIDRAGDELLKTNAITLHKLPFESIDRSVATFDTVARIERPSSQPISELKLMATLSKDYDPYVREGPRFNGESVQGLERSMSEYGATIRSLFSAAGFDQTVKDTAGVLEYSEHI